MTRSKGGIVTNKKVSQAWSYLVDGGNILLGLFGMFPLLVLTTCLSRRLGKNYIERRQRGIELVGRRHELPIERRRHGGEVEQGNGKDEIYWI